jgi:alkanesulfonate monooxygenase SsuD/methylene tetrahydromethanopterin reductase-like flavin-dependent oxidoreductase (luciferase family)
VRISIDIGIADHAWSEARRPEEGRSEEGRSEERRLGARQLERVVTAADEMGVDTVWVTDHQSRTGPGRSPDEALPEVYATLGHLASRTERVRLGAMVNPVGRRAPGLLIDAVTTLDALSGGRAWLGIGAGPAPGVGPGPIPGPGAGPVSIPAEREAAAGEPPAPDGRFERTEDLLRLAHRKWSGDDSPFRGAHGDLAGPHAGLRPLSGPHPPVLIRGNGEARMLPLVARYADACTLYDGPNGGATLRHKFGILAVHLRKTGRPLGNIDTSVSTKPRPERSADELIAHCRHFAGLGIGHLVLASEGPWTERSLRTLASALPAIHALHRQPDALTKAADPDFSLAPV